MLASILQPHIWTANLLFQGLIDGLSIALIAMGIGRASCRERVFRTV